MHLREGEKVLKTYRHHLTPFVFQLFKLALVMAPFYIFLFLLASSMSTKWYYLTHLIFLLFFLLMVAYLSLIYWLDKLIITDQRIIHINWKYLTRKDESDLEIDRIEDIQTKEKGFFAHFKIFDYGTLILETASSYTALTFLNAPDPESIRQFINHIKKQ